MSDSPSSSRLDVLSTIAASSPRMHSMSASPSPAATTPGRDSSIPPLTLSPLHSPFYSPAVSPVEETTESQETVKQEDILMDLTEDDGSHGDDEQVYASDVSSCESVDIFTYQYLVLNVKVQHRLCHKQAHQTLHANLHLTRESASQVERTSKDAMSAKHTLITIRLQRSKPDSVSSALLART